MTTDYWYLGSPYSKYKDGLDAAFEEICRLAGYFARAGISAYSPIAHTHPIAKHSGIDPYDHAIWLPFDTPMMHNAKGLVVVQMDGWDESYGIDQEIRYMRDIDKPIVYLRPAIIERAINLEDFLRV